MRRCLLPSCHLSTASAPFAAATLFSQSRPASSSSSSSSLTVPQVQQLAASFSRLSQLYAARGTGSDRFRSEAFERGAERLHLLCQRAARQRSATLPATAAAAAAFPLEQIRAQLGAERTSSLWQRVEETANAKSKKDKSLDAELRALESDPRVATVLFVSSVLGFGHKKADALAHLVETQQLQPRGPITDIGKLRAAIEFLRRNRGNLQSLPTVEMARHVDQLAAPDGLTRTQRLGLEHHDALQQRIPATEIAAAHEPLLQKAAAAVGGGLMICGSYRRGKATCGDVDAIIWFDKEGDKDAGKKMKSPPLLQRFVDRLPPSYIVDSLAMGETKFMALCRAPSSSSASLVRRIDVRCVSRAELPAATLYFTGSANHNIYLRGVAIDAGLLLNEYGLWAKKKKGNALQRVPGVKTEGDIFAKLGLAYVPPEERE